MKPAPFDYQRPGSLSEAIQLLVDGGGGAKVLAGGQSLVPLLALRFAHPSLLVDITSIPGLSEIGPLDDGGTAIGATVCTHALEIDPTIAVRAPLLAEATPLIAHRQIRNRGTVGGSVAHADPAAELPAVMLALGATLRVAGSQGPREIAIADFFRGFYATALAPDEILTEIRLPPTAPGTGSAFLEIARRGGDFALAGVAAVVTIRDGSCTSAVAALIGVADRPILVPDATDPLTGMRLDETAARAAGQRAAATLTPRSDIHASSRYRQELVAVLVRRALLIAAERGAPAAQSG